MVRAAGGVLALSLIASGCKTNKVVAQPPVVAPPAPASAPAPTVVSKPKHRPAAAPPPAAAVEQPRQPRLGQILSPAEERDFNVAIDQSLANARSRLNSIGTKSLSREQITAVQQINDFMQQAQAARTTDLQAAKGLADKADVLSRDLVRSLR